MRARKLSIDRDSFAIMAILLLAFVLRVWGINFGLPFLYHPDEGAVTMPALEILRTGNLRPIRLDYGSLYIYSLTLLDIPLFFYGVARGCFHSPADLPVFADYRQIGAYSFPAIFLVGRVFTALLGSLTVLAVYLLGLRLAGRRVGLIAALLFAVVPLHVAHSHFSTTDVPMTCVLAWASVFIVGVFDRGAWRDYFWAGLLVGLTASTKYPGGLVLGTLVMGHMGRIRNWREVFSPRAAVGVVMALAGFLFGTPYALDWTYFTHWLSLNLTWYSGAGVEPNALPIVSSWQYYGQELLRSAMAPITLFGIVGFAWFIRRDWRRGVLLITFPILFGCLIVWQTKHYDRFLIPLLPFLTVGAGMTLNVVICKLTRWTRIRRVFAVSGPIALVAILPFAATIQFDRLLAGPDVRTRALEWSKANISPSAKVSADPTGPALQGWSSDLYLTWNLDEHSPEWYTDRKFAYLIISEPRLLDPNLTAQTKLGYRKLMNYYPLIQTFEGAMLGMNNIHIWVYWIGK